MIHIPHKLEHSKILRDRRVFHYTCSPPDRKTLDEYGIQTIGDSYGCRDTREVLLIPLEVFEEFGLVPDEETIRIISETLLTKLKE